MPDSSGGLVHLVGQWLSNSFLLPPTIRQTLYTDIQCTHKQEHTHEAETNDSPQNIYYHVLVFWYFLFYAISLKN